MRTESFSYMGREFLFSKSIGAPIDLEDKNSLPAE